MSLLALPALLKVTGTFALILVLSRFVPLFVGLFAGSAVIGLWMGADIAAIVSGIWRETVSRDTLSLAAVIVMILILSGMLQKSGQLNRIVLSFGRISPGHRFTLAAMPALIGLLPMPGGALFSAPMVESSTASQDVKPELKVAINYWFRHIWEYWWPLYPGIILGISLFHIESWKLIAAQAPLTIGAVLAGCLFILTRVPDPGEMPHDDSAHGVTGFLMESAPIIVVIAVFLGLQAAVATSNVVLHTDIPVPKYTGLGLGLITAMGLVWHRNAIPGDELRRVLLNPGVLPMVMVIVAIMSFKGMLVQTGSIEQMRSELAAYDIPPIAIIALLPLIAGVVTGIAIGFVGASFPLVAALVPPGESPIPFAVLAYGFGYMGMMMSPVHLCLIVTKEFFRADLYSVFRCLWRPAAVVLVWTAGLFACYRWFL